MICSLSARCSMVAAANPVGGHYDKAKTVCENIKMSAALLSRFDLTFILFRACHFHAQQLRQGEGGAQRAQAPL